MRSPEEIVARIGQVKAADWLGIQTTDLVLRLDFDHAKQLLVDTATSEGWSVAEKPPLQEVLEYLPFAWDKANNCRGISAGRSINHMQAWLWLAGYSPEVVDHLSGYDHYGKAQLVFCSTLVDFDWRSADNGSWVNDEAGPSLSREEIDAIAAEWTAKANAVRLPA